MLSDDHCDALFLAYHRPPLLARWTAFQSETPADKAILTAMFGADLDSHLDADGNTGEWN